MYTNLHKKVLKSEFSISIKIEYLLQFVPQKVSTGQEVSPHKTDQIFKEKITSDTQNNFKE